MSNILERVGPCHVFVCIGDKKTTKIRVRIYFTNFNMFEKNEEKHIAKPKPLSASADNLGKKKRCHR